MSTVDPNSKWRNRASGRITISWIMWIVALAGFFVIGWSFDLDGDSERMAIIISILFPLGLILLIGTAFVYPSDEDAFNPRPFFFPQAGMFIFMGAGDIARRLARDTPLNIITLAFVAAGALALVIIELISRRLEARRKIRGRVQGGGVKTRGRVTRARGYYENHHKVTRVTVQFTDSLGTQRWAKQTLGGTARVGDTLSVQYLQHELDSSSAAVVIS
ncbi:MAG: hypothetical protein ACTH1Z_11125 [Ancrocorticia sp.]|uniref:hypothetical protein n=1 Tax=Ancrocorticia sp. TaxID=2593684 RepID=UPI003F8FC732